MSTTLARPTTLRRRLFGLAIAAVIATSGFGANALASHGQETGPSVTGMKKEMCWYQGWFKEGGVWYQGWFKEAC